jgi:hypothetical protein
LTRTVLSWHIWSIGKDWARGLTKETDGRIARAADAHRGLIYQRRAALRSDDKRLKRPRFIAPSSADEWTNGLAYAVGLIATDGCLSGDRKTVVQTSKDLDLLEVFRRCIGTAAPIRPAKGAYRIQVTDVGLYRWLQSIGLTARKSLTLGPLAVPEHLFSDLTRGLLDGDGSVVYSTVVPNPRRYPLKTYPRLRVQFLSASQVHIAWLQERLRAWLDLDGWITIRRKEGRVPLYVLRYSKHEAITLLTKIYEDPVAPRLERKWRVWQRFLASRPTRIWTDRRSDETGRHSGLKHPWAQAREGSNPSSGTD